MLFFALFFGITLLAFIFRRKRWVSVAWLTLVLGIQCYAGLADRIYFPFHNWKHYDKPARTENSFMILHVVDEHGREFPFDDRILSDELFSVGVNVQFAEHIINERGSYNAHAHHIIQAANDLRRELADGRNVLIQVRDTVRRHQARRWSDEEVGKMGRIRGVRFYRYQVAFSDDGREVRNLEKELLHEFFVH